MNDSDCPFYTRLNRRPTTPVTFTGPNAETRTQQSFRSECDTNAIIARAIKTGEPPPFKPGGSYGDFSILTDYQAALAMVKDASEAFDALPAKVRKRFDNDPGQLLDFLADPKNHDEGIELGFFEGPQKAQEPLITVPEGQVVTQTLQTSPQGAQAPKKAS